MKSFQQYTQPKLDELNLPKYDSKITIVEAADPFNIAIVKDKDFDLFKLNTSNLRFKFS